MANTKVATITFHGQQLITAKIDNDVFVAMKPVVSGIGVSWQGQHEKLKSNPARWGVKEILIPSDGGEQSMICLPLRKLHGWLMTIHPGKIKDQEVRENVIVYQNECDDVLWKYYSEGVAINPRLPITPEQQSALQAIVATISPDGKQRGMIWARFNRHFKIAMYRQLPSAKFEEAKAYLVQTFLNGEYVEQAELDMKAYVAAHNVTLADVKEELRNKLLEDAAIRALTKPGQAFLTTFGLVDGKPFPVLYSMPEDSFYLTAKDIASYIGDPGGRIKQDMLPGIIAAAAQRLQHCLPRLSA